MWLPFVIIGVTGKLVNLQQSGEWVRILMIMVDQNLDDDDDDDDDVDDDDDYETGSMTGILGQLKWESLKKRRKDNRLILLYKGLKGKAKIPTDDLIPKTRHGRNQHSLAFQIPSASKDVYMYSFFPQTIRDWNDLPESLISSSELSDDSLSKFTSLVRARD